MTPIATSVARLSITALWLLSPPLFIFFALRQWYRAGEQHPFRWKTAWPVVIGTAVLSDWLLFVIFLTTGRIGGFGTHYATNPRMAIFGWLSVLLVIGSVATNVGRGKLCTAGLLISALWFGSLFVA